MKNEQAVLAEKILFKVIFFPIAIF